MNLQQMDAELERLSKLHKETWGQIQQLQSERNFALMQAARANARSESAPAVQMATWNDSGHVNHNFDVEEILR